MFYTDGAYSFKTEMGGWAVAVYENGNLISENSGNEPYTTNNRMELMAFLSALKLIDSINTSAAIDVSIMTDSSYISNALNLGWYRTWMKNGWKTSDRQDVKNQDLWGPILALYISLKAKINLQVVKVKAHHTDTCNQYVDSLAVSRRKELEGM